MCEVPSCPENQRGAPRPFRPLPSRCCRRRKVPICPQSPKPWERGDAFQKDKQPELNKTNLHTRAYTDTKVNDGPLPISLSLPSLRRPERHSAAGPPNPSTVRSRPGSTPSLPSALSAWGVGASRLPGGTQPSRWGRPRINLLPARRPKGSEGHDGSAPRVHVSQHRLIAADLPRLCGFRPALLSLGFLPAAPGAFP